MSQEHPNTIYVRCTLEGDIARMYRELESRGLVKSIREAIARGISAYYEKVMEGEQP